MSDIMLVVPVEGLMELFVYPVDAKTFVPQPMVRVDLGYDGRERGAVFLTLDADQPLNRRATEITGVLTGGSYVQVTGRAAFTDITEEQAALIMLSKAVIP